MMSLSDKITEPQHDMHSIVDGNIITQHPITQRYCDLVKETISVIQEMENIPELSFLKGCL